MTIASVSSKEETREETFSKSESKLRTVSRKDSTTSVKL